MISIDPDKRDDIYYRYKMPSVQVKVESSGNGIKTVVPNIHDVCTAINRPEEVLMKFFQAEVGAQSTKMEKSDKFFIMGNHTQERIQDKIYDFIRMFVLCRGCGNPETHISVKREKNGGSLSMSCGACGEVRKINDCSTRYITAFATYFKNHPQAAHSSGAGTAEARENVGHAARVPGQQNNKLVGKRVVQKSDMAETREPPHNVLARYMKEHEGNKEGIICCCMELISSYNLKERLGPQLVLNAIAAAEDKFITGLRRYAYLLKRFCHLPESALRDLEADELAKTEILQRHAQLHNVTLDECTRICIKHLKPERLVVVLFVLFLEGVVKSDMIGIWLSNEKTFAKLEPDVRAEIEKALKPLLNWLNVEVVKREDAKATAPIADEEKGGARKDAGEDMKKGKGKK
ncbi:putative eukaryotic translation initiation factor 5 [Trypanosoma vivax]|nr:putative eukaryotic translation initiation factor 5 [Trypanosoma vivax]